MLMPCWTYCNVCVARVRVVFCLFVFCQWVTADVVFVAVALLVQELASLQDESEMRAGAAREGLEVADKQTVAITEEANGLRSAYSSCMLGCGAAILPRVLVVRRMDDGVARCPLSRVSCFSCVGIYMYLLYIFFPTILFILEVCCCSCRPAVQAAECRRVARDAR